MSQNLTPNPSPMERGEKNGQMLPSLSERGWGDRRSGEVLKICDNKYIVPLKFNIEIVLFDKCSVKLIIFTEHLFFIFYEQPFCHKTRQNKYLVTLLIQDELL